MDFVNESGFPAGWTLGFEPDGRELLVIAVKATYRIPKNGEKPILAAEQLPLTEADEFTGEPGMSAPLQETDYSHRKPKCDVVLNGSAYAPGRPSTRVKVSLQVGSMSKSFYVFGDRKWDRILLDAVPTPPEPFTKQSISYDFAYGGADVDPDNPEKIATLRENPIGVGYRPLRPATALLGEPLPNTSETREPIEDTKQHFRPMSFGPVGRNFFPRYRHAGTYDADWLANHAPFWPADFSSLYFQCAPVDQQAPHLDGGEQVVLENLTPDGYRIFAIPSQRMLVTLIPYHSVDRIEVGICDTLLLSPDEELFSLTWRVSYPLRRNCFELKQVIVGDMPLSWHSRRRAEAKGKTYYRNLAELADSKPKRLEN